jgi:isoaspartyl peptidase/L-asparaginase-like protein (Ntn-hydrolase superfamily)
MGFVLAVHGGAGLSRRHPLEPEDERAATQALVRALDAGARVLSAGGSALDAVEAAVVILEDDPALNAGRGSVLNAAGEIEMDAAIMDGRDRRAGAVAAARLARNPIRAARAVMERTPHVLLVGPAADALAGEAGLPLCDPAWFMTERRRRQLAGALETGRVQMDHDGSRTTGTVGAVALDAAHHLAAATSTGGMVGKRPGRVSDSALIGAGTYASDGRVAVSCTGHGEPFIRLGVAARLGALCELSQLDLAAAADRVIHRELPAVGGMGGLIALDAAGNLAMPFNSDGMLRGFVRADVAAQIQVWK